MLAGHNDPTIDKAPPKSPTQVSFPDVRPLVNKQTKPWTEADYPNLFKIFSDLSTARRGNGVDDLIWKAININFASEVDIQDLIESSAAKEFFPPSDWLDPPTKEQRSEICYTAVVDGSVPKLHNNRQWPNRGDFYDRIHDFMYTNEEAYHGLTRQVKDGKPAPRITNGRPFFIALDEMGQYWDTSLDEYFLGPDASDADNPTEVDDATEYPNGSNGFYRGYRAGTGSDMPSMLRINAVRALVEVVMYPFAFQIPAFENKAHNFDCPHLEIKNLRCTVSALTRRIWRIPTDPAKARSGVGEGPALGFSCRNDVRFSIGVGDGQKDLLKETASLVILAQERARQGKPEPQPGEGKFWASKPRWAGHAYSVPGEYQLDQLDRDHLKRLRAEEEERKTKYAIRKREDFESHLNSSMTQRQRSIEKYKDMTLTTSSLWVPKAEYISVGKDKNSAYDDVFLVSSLNHHIAILKLRVHAAYLDYLGTGVFPANAASLAADWSEPVIERSRWYDLFNSKDRIQIFRSLWAVAGYLART
jgi:hypothetical protein